MEAATAKAAAETPALQLEAALLQIVQKHHRRSPANASKLRVKKNALRSAVRVADLLAATVDGGRGAGALRQRAAIDLEARALLATIARYRKQTDQWLAASNAINSVLKEIGDFEN